MAELDKDPVTIEKRAYLCLRQFVLSPYTQPGTQLTIRSLVDRFHVGRTPLRSALTLLTLQGLVELRPRKGYFTKRPSVRDIHGLYVMNGYLMQGCLSDAAKKRKVVNTEFDVSCAPNPENVGSRQGEAHRLADCAACLFWSIGKISGSDAVLDALSLATERLWPLRIAENQVFADTRAEIVAMNELFRRGRYADLINACDDYHARRVSSLRRILFEAYGRAGFIDDSKPRPSFFISLAHATPRSVVEQSANQDV